MEPPTLVTERLMLRPLDERDVESVQAACQDPEIVRWIPVPEPYGREDAEQFVCGVSPAGWRDDTMYNFGVFTKSGGLVGSMGLVRLWQLGTPERQAELGFWTVKEQRGNGYTVEAGRAVIDWAFSELKAERLEWVAEAGNLASRAVARRLGFVMEGTQRAKIVQRGIRRDAWVAALLPTDLGQQMETPYLPASGRSRAKRPA
ncbi:acetyltransferase [Streptomyces abyssalis]|uniref:Acetyltransferase n=1 Tax=Streptomyces abyssalis TaxID=933944 RepID=A0A1E7JJ66_9ACTN|nr:GNAT family N-acetyltransferase [Streptomyces abyssalis]OEU87157.1 acetyltransferase [Streptomyces abyssalis]OEU87691.1 acetyltransferase [Streptomyces abyssalis]OEV14218.1 acetyltransferase [Streptomyces nanshensis]